MSVLMCCAINPLKAFCLASQSLFALMSFDVLRTSKAFYAGPGFPIRTSPDQSFFASSPKLFAGLRVLHRLLPPRHPPHALVRLTL
jgi:hypothetical protein